MTYIHCLSINQVSKENNLLSCCIFLISYYNLTLTFCIEGVGSPLPLLQQYHYHLFSTPFFAIGYASINKPLFPIT